MKQINWYKLLVIVLITQITGLLANLLSGNTRQVYQALIKPPFAPPGWLFGVVWPILYLLMAIAAYLIYQTPVNFESKRATDLYWVQLMVNFLWSIVFFRFGWYWVSVAVIVLLDLLVFTAVFWFFKLKKAAGYLMIPYLLWILYATYLNIGFAMLN